MAKDKKELGRLRRRKHIRKKVWGMPERPRLSVHRSLKNLYSQIINDESRRTLASASTLDKEFRHKCPYGGNIKAAAFLGKILAQRAKGLNIGQVVFDRGGYLYHGRIRAFAEAARKEGLKF